jgi:hypothetical protein
MVAVTILGDAYPAECRPTKPVGGLPVMGGALGLTRLNISGDAARTVP